MTTPSIEPKSTNRKALLIGGVIAAFVGVITLGQFLLNQNSGDVADRATAINTSATSETAKSRSDLANAEVAPPSSPLVDSPLALRDPADKAAIGAIDAPLVVTEWTDLRCPYCAAFTNTTFPTIIDEYVATGQVRLEIAPIALFGDESFKAAVASHAAGEQGKFVEYLQTVYANAPAGGKPDMPREKLVAFAEAAGVPDIAKFTADLDNPELHKKVTDETNFALQIGVNSVPFFLAGEVSMPGAQPIETFREYLNHFFVDGQ